MVDCQVQVAIFDADGIHHGTYCKIMLVWWFSSSWWRRCAESGSCHVGETKILPANNVRDKDARLLGARGDKNCTSILLWQRSVWIGNLQYSVRSILQILIDRRGTAKILTFVGYLRWAFCCCGEAALLGINRSARNRERGQFNIQPFYSKFLRICESSKEDQNRCL